MNNTCGSCAKYPFCKNTIGANMQKCDKYMRKPLQKCDENKKIIEKM